MYKTRIHVGFTARLDDTKTFTADCNMCACILPPIPGEKRASWYASRSTMGSVG